jgi:hypothetical protein
MKELLVIACTILGIAAFISTMSAVRYNYKVTPLVDNEFIPRVNSEEEESEEQNYATEVIYEKNLFDKMRGEEPPEGSEEIPEEVKSNANYAFELRGIIGVGTNQVALMSAALSGKAAPVRGRTPTPNSPAPVGARSDKIHICKVGADIGDSGYKVKSIENGQVKIEDSKGNHQVFHFSLVTDESLKRSEVAFKEDQSKQKEFANQNKFVDPKPPEKQVEPAPTDGKPKEKTQEEREEEMRQRAEKLKEEMKRLKELRDNNGDDKNGDDKNGEKDRSKDKKDDKKDK